MNSKYLSFATFLAGIITLYANKWFGLEINTASLISAIVVGLNFAATEMVLELKRLKAGEIHKMDTMRLIAMLITAFGLIISQYFGIDLSIEDMICIVLTSAAFFGIDLRYDYKKINRNGGSTHEPTQYHIDDSTHI